MSKKMPGISLAPRTEIDGRILNLGNKTKFELQELLDREKKILANVKFVSKLPDRGARIIFFCEKLLKELKGKDVEENTCKLLSELKLESKDAVENIEWRVNDNKSATTAYLDSDDDSDPEDVLRILAQSRPKEKTIKHVKESPFLIKPEDIDDSSKSNKNYDSLKLPHTKYLVDITEKKPEGIFHEKFLPYKTTITNVHDPSKEMLRKKNKFWEVTAATPPLTVHGLAQQLTLAESLHLQKSYNEHLKVVEAEHAATKLALRAHLTIGCAPQHTTQAYRNVEGELSDDSENEVLDYEPEIGGVVYTVEE